MERNAFDCPEDLAAKLLELRHKARGDYQGQAFARRILRQAFDLHQVGKTEFARLSAWTYTWGVLSFNGEKAKS